MTSDIDMVIDFGLAESAVRDAQEKLRALPREQFGRFACELSDMLDRLQASRDYHEAKRHAEATHGL